MKLTPEVMEFFKQVFGLEAVIPSESSEFDYLMFFSDSGCEFDEDDFDVDSYPRIAIELMKEAVAEGNFDERCRDC